MVASIVDRHASEAVRRSLLPRLASMELLGAYCLTEPGSGSDAAALRTVAERERGGDGRDGYVLTGSKAFISGAGAADVYVVMARVPGAVNDSGGGGGNISVGLGRPLPPSGGAAADAGKQQQQGGGGSGSSSKGGSGSSGGITAFLVEKGAPGLSFGPPEKKMGWRMQPTCAVTLDGVRVPAERRLGAEGEGFKIAMKALDGGRVNIAACSVGGAAAALDAAYRYAHERRQFGQVGGW